LQGTPAGKGTGRFKRMSMLAKINSFKSISEKPTDTDVVAKMSGYV
jgi:hypothetical protein